MGEVYVLADQAWYKRLQRDKTALFVDPEELRAESNAFRDDDLSVLINPPDRDMFAEVNRVSIFLPYSMNDVVHFERTWFRRLLKNKPKLEWIHFLSTKERYHKFYAHYLHMLHEAMEREAEERRRNTMFQHGEYVNLVGNDVNQSGAHLTPDVDGRRKPQSFFTHAYHEIRRENLHPNVRSLKLKFSGCFTKMDYTGIAGLLNSGLVDTLAFECASQFYEFRDEAVMWERLVKKTEGKRTCAVTTIALDGSEFETQTGSNEHFWGTVPTIPYELNYREELGIKMAKFVGEFAEILESVFIERDRDDAPPRRVHLDLISLNNMGRSDIKFQRHADRRAELAAMENVSLEFERLRREESATNALINPIIRDGYRALFARVVKYVPTVVLNSLDLNHLNGPSAKDAVLFPNNTAEWMSNGSRVKRLSLLGMPEVGPAFSLYSGKWNEFGAPLEGLEIQDNVTKTNWLRNAARLLPPRVVDTKSDLPFSDLETLLDALRPPPPPPQASSSPPNYLIALKDLIVMTADKTHLAARDDHALSDLVMDACSNPAMRTLTVDGYISASDFEDAMHLLATMEPFNLRTLNLAHADVPLELGAELRVSSAIFDVMKSRGFTAFMMLMPENLEPFWRNAMKAYTKIERMENEAKRMRESTNETFPLRRRGRDEEESAECSIT